MAVMVPATQIEAAFGLDERSGSAARHRARARLEAGDDVFVTGSGRWRIADRLRSDLGPGCDIFVCVEANALRLSLR